jgi:hypothetical protein
MDLVRCIFAVAAGGAIGIGFGMLQEAALRRNEKQQQAGRLGSGWAVMPGSMRRTAYLLLALIVVQVVCPRLFTDGIQWWVSGGVVVGYGVMLYRELRRRQSQGA